MNKTPRRHVHLRNQLFKADIRKKKTRTRGEIPYRQAAKRTTDKVKLFFRSLFPHASEESAPGRGPSGNLG